MKTIEEMTNTPIWVLKYDVYFYPKGHVLDGCFANKGTPGAVKSTSCHGWYETEEEALTVRNNFTYPSEYRLEKVYQRKLKETSIC
jgi:hypothetical protein